MQKLTKFSFYAVLFLLSTFKSYGSSMSYDEAWNLGGNFDGPRLRNVVHLYPSSDNQLDISMQDSLASSKALINVKVLDLSHQDIDDNFIERLCKNRTFSRVINLDLSGNPKITDKSLELISISDIIGSIRDLPQISGKYGIPSSEIYIYTQDTSINSKTIKEYQEAPKRFDFSIRYLNLNGQRTASSVSDSIKWLQCR